MDSVSLENPDKYIPLIFLPISSPTHPFQEYRCAYADFWMEALAKEMW